MQLNNAREAWHSAYYTPTDSVTHACIIMARLGRLIQTTVKQRHAAFAVHQALAGRIQSTISQLPPDVRNFGHHLYSPLAEDDEREQAEALVFYVATQRYKSEKRMTRAKYERARYVAAGVLYRYRRMNQGGQSSAPDPLASPEAFRRWLFDQYGVRLVADRWSREWVEFVGICFEVCDELDRAALGPVGRTLRALKKEVAA
jgi:hypothetical protein